MGPNGRKLPHPTFPHPEDCQKFYICRNGVQPQKGSCSDRKVYNDETFQCDDPQNVPGWLVYYIKAFFVYDSFLLSAYTSRSIG